MPLKSANLGLRPGLRTVCPCPALPEIDRALVSGLSLRPKLRFPEGLF
jgi:hypothetical protein